MGSLEGDIIRDPPAPGSTSMGYVPPTPPRDWTKVRRPQGTAVQPPPPDPFFHRLASAVAHPRREVRMALATDQEVDPLLTPLRQGPPLDLPSRPYPVTDAFLAQGYAKQEPTGLIPGRPGEVLDPGSDLSDFLDWLITLIPIPTARPDAPYDPYAEELRWEEWEL
jgi:hypothetical protein